MNEPEVIELDPYFEPVSRIMSTEVIAVGVDDPIDAVRALFLEERISGAPVVDLHERLCGVVTKTDLVRDSWLVEEADDAVVALRPDERARLGEGFQVVPGPRATVRDVMTPYALCVPPDASVARVAALMVYEEVHRVFVAEPQGYLIGVVSVVDVARWAAEMGGFLVPSARRRAA